MIENERKNGRVEGFLYNRSLHLPRLPFLAFAYFGPASYMIIQLLSYGPTCGLIGASKAFSDAHTANGMLDPELKHIYAECINAETGVLVGLVLLVTVHLFLRMAVLLKPKQRYVNGHSPNYRGNTSRPRGPSRYNPDDDED